VQTAETKIPTQGPGQMQVFQQQQIQSGPIKSKPEAIYIYNVIHTIYVRTNTPRPPFNWKFINQFL